MSPCIFFAGVDTGSPKRLVQHGDYVRGMGKRRDRPGGYWRRVKLQRLVPSVLRMAEFGFHPAGRKGGEGCGKPSLLGGGILESLS